MSDTPEEIEETVRDHIMERVWWATEVAAEEEDTPMQTVTETPFLRVWRQHPQLPIEAAYERYARGETSYAEYRRDYADPEEAQRVARRRALYQENRHGR